MRIIVAITGASGVIYGIRLLQALKSFERVETHLVVSKWAQKTIELETDYTIEQVYSLADNIYSCDDMSASISSGTFHHDGMIVVPCSMKTLAAIANGYAEELIGRASDVTIKERRKLVLAVRETPLNPIHLDNMLKLSRIGAVIMPPVPSFYTKPETIDDLIDQFVGKILDAFGLESSTFKRWRSQ
ncbi:MAG: UbiX family flavin prenyltransferase [Acetivibrionales bacterium]|jgi:4-hydroxy-3-polyprenylbenzoate decarboxylase